MQTSPRLMIHGGLGTEKSEIRSDRARLSLQRIIAEAYAFLEDHSALEAVQYAVGLLENDPLFNAGTGSKLQQDGVIRMTASVMDGNRQRFAGVINIREVQHPVQVAAALLDYDDRVLAGDEAVGFARKHGFPPYQPEIAVRRMHYEKKLAGKSGTVGCVALDSMGFLAAATSTGGKGFEIPGRVSDSATVAGNYANAMVAISCTGTGEDIVDAALAARVAVRHGDGVALQRACNQAIEEIHNRGGFAGLIALNIRGEMVQAATHPQMAYARHDGESFQSF